MAHFAKISENNEVLSVVTLNNVDMHDAEGVEDETIGQQYLETHSNWPSHLWIQTSYNTLHNTHVNGGNSFRGNYAGTGSIWDSTNNIFWNAKPYVSWVKDLATASWKSPIGDAPELTAEQITADCFYIWNEDNQSWDLRTP